MQCILLNVKVHLIYLLFLVCAAAVFMMTDYPKSLYDKHVCRVFFSSPFNGMQAEREILARRYWPRLQSYCESHGVHFRAVDLRWGITHDAAENAQVLNICLNEINRSDILVGFYGQRYGWHGLNDAVLQSNFDNVSTKYPWVNEYRDRSVTELEFLHGFLNNPEQKPACVCFRSKEYDNKQKQIYTDANNLKYAAHYTVESENAANRLEDLKRRCRANQSSLGVLLDYKTPEDGAKYIFDYIWNHITTHLLTDADSNSTMSERETLLVPHEAFLLSRSSIYIGGEENFQKLDQFVVGNSTLPMLITSDPGTGKSALLSTWIKKKRKHCPSTHFIHHFVGCAKGSAELPNILNRLIIELQCIIGQQELSVDSKVEEEDSIKTSNVKVKEQSTNTLARDMQELLKKCTSTGKQIILVVDGLEKIRDSKVGRPAFWLPKDISGNISILTSTASTDSRTIEELCVAHDCPRLELDLINEADKRELCDTLLKENSKVLNQEKIDMICSGRSTNNPLFLRIVIDELCVYGSFRLLEDQISNLIECKTVQDIFSKYLDRLLNDFKVQSGGSNIVQDVLSALVFCKIGLSEEDLIEMFDFQSSQWSPLYFAIDRYLIIRNGKLAYAYDELACAIEEKYISSEKDKQRIVMHMANYFERKHRKTQGNGEPISKDAVQELARLLQMANQKMRLQQLLCEVDVFLYFYRNKLYDLIELVRSLKLDTIVLAKRFLSAIDCFAAKLYNTKMNSYDSDINVVQKTVNAFMSLGCFFNYCKYFNAEQMVWRRVLRIYEHNKVYTEDKLLNHQAWTQYKLACLSSEVEDYRTSVSLHANIIRIREKLRDKKSSEYVAEELAMSYHGIALAYAGDEKREKAIAFYRKSISIYSSLKNPDMPDISKSHNNIGAILIQLKRYNEAMKELETAFEMESNYYFGQLPPDVSYTMHNIGLCYRRLNNFDMAEKWYMRSLNIKVNALGWDDPDVATSHMNIGTLNLHRKEHSKAEEHFRKCLAINEKYYEHDTSKMVMALENLAHVLAMQTRFEEGEEFYQPALRRLLKIDRMDKCLPMVHRKFARWYEKLGKWKEACIVWEALAGRSNVREVDYTNLWKFYDRLPADKNVVIQGKDKFSIVAATKLWPTGKFIIAYRTNAAIESKDFTAVEEMLIDYMRKVSDAKEVCTSIVETLLEENYKVETKNIFTNIKSKLPIHESTIMEILELNNCV